MLIRSIVFASVLACATACGGGPSADTPRQYCENFSSALCQQVYACFTADEIAASGLPPEESACITTSDANRGCEAQTDANACTGGNETFDGIAAARCVDDVAGLTCAEVRALLLQGVVPSDAPECAQVCVAH